MMLLIQEPVPLSTAGAWALVSFIWQGALLAIAFAVTRKMMARSTPKLRYAIGIGSLSIMALCPILTFATLELRPPAVSDVSPLPGSGALPTSGLKPQTTPEVLTSVIAWTDRNADRILTLWLFGFVFFSVRMIIAMEAARQLKTRASEAAPAELQERLHQLSSQLKLSIPVRLISSGRTTAPVVTGWRAPVIVLPASSLEGLSLAQAETVLAHELAHIRRRDYAVNLLQVCIESLLFCHPAIWWISREVRREREYCCDDLALSTSGSRLNYAKALMVLEERRSSLRTRLSLGMSGGNLSMRIRRIFDGNKAARLTRQARVSLLSLACCTLALLAVLSISSANRVSAQTATPAASGPITGAHPSVAPDMSCTFYNKKGQAAAGTCMASDHTYYCGLAGGKKLRQIQEGCGWKVQRMHAWQQQNIRKQGDRK